jgi:hypothetical protein
MKSIYIAITELTPNSSRIEFCPATPDAYADAVAYVNITCNVTIVATWTQSGH